MSSTKDFITEFPIWALVPKKETGVTDFIKKYPDYNGKGVVIAILDSGVDPNVEGLRKLPSGKPKVIERFDCSGAGDIDTSKVVESSNRTITGLTGKIIQIPENWNNPTNEYHLGIIHAFQFYPERLKERVEEEQKRKNWTPQHLEALAKASRKLQQFDLKHVSNSLSVAEKQERDDLEAQIQFLTVSDKKYSDEGPTYDCILFHNGNYWCLCIDTSDSGDVSNIPCIGEYSVTHEHRFLTEEDQLTISFNVHDNGNLLEIVGMASTHGTHVASIAAGYFPESPERNGVAPEAEIVSLTIGDLRIKGMETGTGLVRAMIKIMELSKTKGIDVINMSYGEHAHWANSGRIGELMCEIVNKYGVIWISSAGNNGPALSTVGSPPDISQPVIIGVGAYVSPEMMLAEYSIRNVLSEMPYTWSSRGPTIDGHNGVTVCAPGAAITCVSSYSLKSFQLMNGTSMSAPHVAGAVGIILSGLKAQAIPYSPFSVRRALENSARFLDGVETFAQGHGLMQVEPAFDELVKYSKDCPLLYGRFDVSANNGQKGVYIRNLVSEPFQDFNITVNPVFLDDSTIVTHTDKSQFALSLVLTCKADYVDYPSFLEMANGQRIFTIRIHLDRLKPGIYATYINGFDTKCVQKGPLLRVPITVVKPETIACQYSPKLSWSDVRFVPNTIKRHFIAVPDAATWAVLRFVSAKKNELGKFAIHTIQIQPNQSCKQKESHTMSSLCAVTDNQHVFQVLGGLTLEICIAKYWATLDDIELSYSVTFYGAKSRNQTVTMHGAEVVQMLPVRTLSNEEIAPVVTLTSNVYPLRPTDASINPLSTRDVVPPQRQIYELVLTYTFNVAKQTKVIPNCSVLNDMLYESEFESQLWFIFDGNKKLIAVGDAYPFKYGPKLEKGDYTLKLQIRQEKRELLEKYLELPIFIYQKITYPLTLDVYASKNQALLNGKKMSATDCSTGNTIPIYINALPSDKMPKVTHYGQFLAGNLTFVKDEAAKKVDVFPFKYILPEAGKKNNTKSTDKEKTKYEEYLEAVRDTRAAWMVKLEGTPQVKEIFNAMKEENPNCPTAYFAFLQSIDSLDVAKHAPSYPPSGDFDVDVADEVHSIEMSVANLFNFDSLLAYYGMKTDTRPDAAKIKIQMDRQKTFFIEYFVRRGIIECKRYVNTPEKEREDIFKKITTIWEKLMQISDTYDSRTIYFSMWYSMIQGHYGSVLMCMKRYIDEKPNKELELKMISICRLLDWNHCADFMERTIHIKYPSTYALF